MLAVSLLVVTSLANVLTTHGYLPGTSYSWGPGDPNYNPSAAIYAGTIDTSNLVMGNFLGVSPIQPNAPGHGDSGSIVSWDDNWVYGIGDGNTNGDWLDGRWVHIIYPAEGWWDLGSATNRVVVFLSQDHGPYLAEGLETKVYGSNTLWGAVSAQAVLTEVYLDGWRSHNTAEDVNGNGWCSDDVAGVYQLPGMYRYVKLAAWSSVGALNEPEVDAVARMPVVSNHRILREEWRFDMYWYGWGYFGASSAIADLGVNTVGGEPNSDLEIATGSDELWGPYQDGVSSAGVWRAFDSGGNLEWQRGTQTDEARSSLVIADIDGDGDLEMAGGTTSGWYFEVLDHLGNFVWTFPKRPGIYQGGPFVWPSSPAAADLNSSASLDGLELVIGNRWLGNVWAFDGDNSDGINDGVTIAYADYPWYYWNGTHWVYELTGTEGIDWDVLWVFPSPGLGDDKVWATPAIGDVDNDGDLEVVIGDTNGNLYVLNGATGNQEYAVQIGPSVYASAALANLDGDAYLEMVIGSTNGTIFALQWDGTAGSTEWAFTTGGAIYSSAAIGDIDNDGALEVVVGSNDNKVYALGGGAGGYIWSFTTGGDVYSSPALAERCNVDPYDKDWPMFRNNPSRTGLYGKAPPTSLDVYVGSDDGYLYIIEGDDGTEIDRFMVNVGPWMWGPQAGIHTSPVVADVDGDKNLEIFFYDWGRGSALGGHTYWALEDAIIRKEISPTSGGLGTVVHITLHVGVPVGVTVKVVDTLPEGFKYIIGTFKVNGVSATPTVVKNEVSYTITAPCYHKIEFDVKVDKAWWEDRTVYNTAKVTWLKNNVARCEKEVKVPFVIEAFTDLHKQVARIDWPKFHYDLPMTGYTTSKAPNTNATLWIYNTTAPSGPVYPIYSSPAIVDGKVYIGSENGKLYKLDGETGALLWSYSTGQAIRSSPAVESGKVYFLSTNGKMYALNTANGALVWSLFIDTGSVPWSSPAVHDGKVYIGASNGTIYALNAATGAVVWSTVVGGYPNGPITVANKKVYSGTHSGKTLVALKEADGSLAWQYFHPGGGFVDSNGAAVADGDGDGKLDVYFGVVVFGGVGQAIALNEADGSVKWTYTFRAITGRGPGPKGPGWSTSTPAVHGGKVFIGSDDEYVYALDAGTGAKVWEFQTKACVWTAPAVADGKVFVGSNDHTLYALNEATGGLVWFYNTSLSRIHGSPAVADGKVFVGSENGNVYAFGPSLLTVKVKTNVQWKLVMEVTNPFGYTMTSVVVTDRLGAELEIDPPFPYSITHGTVSYTTKGTSQKVFLTWTIGNLLPGETARLVILVSTDYNPGRGDCNEDNAVDILDVAFISAHWTGVPEGPLGYDRNADMNKDDSVDILDVAAVSSRWGLSSTGKQEYTEPGIYELNSGATLKFIDPEQNMQLSAVTDSIYVTALPAEDP